MFSETYAGGTVRMVREATKHLPQSAGHLRPQRRHRRQDPRHLARGDRLPGPARRHRFPPDGPGAARLALTSAPTARSGSASEEALTRPIAGINPTMITRAGALDQGNLILNLQDLEAKGIAQNVLFLAGSAINTIKDKSGKPDPRIGLEAMLQAIEVHRSGELKDTPIDEHLAALAALAERKNLTALREALRQRYPGKVA